MELLEMFIHFLVSSVLPCLWNWVMQRVKMGMGLIQSRLGMVLVLLPVAGTGEAQDLPWMGRWGFAASAHLLGTCWL